MIGRRQLLMGALASTAALGFAPYAYAANKSRIVVVGGGFGGATATKFLARLLPSAEITLISGEADYFSCPFSNLLITSDRDPSSQMFRLDFSGYQNVNHIRARANDVRDTQSVIIEDGTAIPFDRLILSPGIQFQDDAVEGYSEEAREVMPAAWGSPEELFLLRRQLDDMSDGGTVIVSVPYSPYRCPPGPYERASLIAHYLKTQKPRSKLIILDSKDKFSKMALFQEAWAEKYPGHIEWRGASDDGRVVRLNLDAMSVHTDFEDLKSDVVNFIPPQKAARIAERAGVTDASGWCPINGLSFESKLRKNIHVIGDACIANPMPKSAFSANLQGKIVAIAIARSLMDLAPEPTTLVNTCYSYVSLDEAVSISAVYRNDDGVLQSVSGSGGTTPLSVGTAVRQNEAAQARDWFQAITAETFA